MGVSERRRMRAKEIIRSGGEGDGESETVRMCV